MNHMFKTLGPGAYSKFVLALLTLNLAYVLLTIVFIVFPNFYFGLQTTDALLLSASFLLLTLAHIYVARTKRSWSLMLPLLLSCLYLAGLYAANILP